MVDIVPADHAPNETERLVLQAILDRHSQKNNVPDWKATPFSVMARQDGTLIGGIWGYTDSWGRCHIEVFGVEEEERQQGVGEQLLASVEQVAIKRGCDHIEVGTRSFHLAKRLYEKLGYKLLSQLGNYPLGQTAYTYIKSLSEITLADIIEKQNFRPVKGAILVLSE